MVYERWDYLHTAISDALGQTYRNIEVIVSDDSIDSRADRLLASVDDPRLVVRHNERTLGPGGNFVAAARSAQGEFIASLNDDDRWKPQFLQAMLDALEAEPEAVLAFCDHDVIDERGKVDRELTEATSRRYGRQRLRVGLHKPFIELALVRKSVFFANAVVVRRDALALDELARARIRGDWDEFCCYLTSRSGAGAVYVGERLAQHRSHASQLTAAGEHDHRSKLGAGESQMRSNQQYRSDERLREWWGVFDRRWAESATTVAIAHIRSGDLATGRALAKQSLGTDRTARAVVALALTYAPQAWARRIACWARRPGRRAGRSRP